MYEDTANVDIVDTFQPCVIEVPQADESQMYEDRVTECILGVMDPVEG